MHPLPPNGWSQELLMMTNAGPKIKWPTSLIGISGRHLAVFRLNHAVGARGMSTRRDLWWSEGGQKVTL